MAYTTVNSENIRIMVHDFYSIILQDETLSPFFTKALGSDLKNGKWPEHFQTLSDFWVLMMTGIPGYKGDPFPPHAFLGRLSTENFETWLKLFHEVVYRLYTPQIAEKFYNKATVLASQFIDNLGLEDEDEDD